MLGIRNIEMVWCIGLMLGIGNFEIVWWIVCNVRDRKYYNCMVDRFHDRDILNIEMML